MPSNHATVWPSLRFPASAALITISAGPEQPNNAATTPVLTDLTFKDCLRLFSQGVDVSIAAGLFESSKTSLCMTWSLIVVGCHELHWSKPFIGHEMLAYAFHQMPLLLPGSLRSTANGYSSDLPFQWLLTTWHPRYH